MNIYVSGISSETTEEELRTEFGTYGPVSTVKIIKDAFTGLPRGFAFVDMSNDTEAQAAISGLNGKELKGKSLTVNKARPRTENRGGNDRRGPGGNGGGNRYGGGSNYRRGY